MDFKLVLIIAMAALIGVKAKPQNLQISRMLSGKYSLPANLVHAHCVYHQTPRCCSGEMKEIVLAWMRQHNSCVLLSGINPQVGGNPMEFEYELKDSLTLSMLTMTGIIGQKL